MEPVDPAVLTALEDALTRDPENNALRLHFARLIFDSGDPARALAHSQAVLASDPMNRGALGLGAEAARATGDDALAAAYEQLAGTTGSPPVAPTPVHATGPETHPSSSGDPAFDAELEAFMSNALEDVIEVEQSSVSLADVGGMDSVKQQIERSFLGPMRSPELREMYGKSLRGGLLLYGPPGCGKTFLARAIAGELDANFFAIGLHEVLDMWLGQSEHNLHEAFERARRNAPCVLFLDEVDALGQKRSNLTRSAGRNVVVQLLAELDSVGSDNEGVFVLGATNQPWDIDPALRRPGRFDRTVLVLPPDEVARRHILAVHLRDRPTDGIDVSTLASRTADFSGADLHYACEVAAEYAIEDSMRTGHARPISMTDMAKAISTITPSTRSWFDIARNFVTFANQSGEYDDLYQYMRSRKLV